MRVLLDTHIMLWALATPSLLSKRARQVLDKAQSLYVSSASIWEISIKSGLGKIDADMDVLLETLTQYDIKELPVTWEHAKAVQTLPPYHRDPFDRILIAQAEIEPMLLLTQDSLFKQYQLRNIKVV